MSSLEGKLRYVHDSKAWKHVNDLWPHFANEPRNIRFGLAMDGVNPFRQNRVSHSTWPVLLMNYNIPHWVAIKKGHVFLSLIIPGPKACKNPDVFMAPLIEELQELWDKGIACVDTSRKHNDGRSFRFYEIVLWTIYDWPGICTNL